MIMNKILKHIKIHEDKIHEARNALESENGVRFVQRVKHTIDGRFSLRLIGRDSFLLGRSRKWRKESNSIDAYNEIIRAIDPESERIIGDKLSWDLDEDGDELSWDELDKIQMENNSWAELEEEEEGSWADLIDEEDSWGL